MARRTRENQVQLLDDKINILERNEAEASPGVEQVFKTVSGIQALVRDKMISNASAVRLSDYCFGVCEVLKSADDRSQLVRIELEDLRRSFIGIMRTLRRGANTPRMEYDKGKVARHKLKIQEILNTLDTPTSSYPGRGDEVSSKRVPKPLPIDSRDVATTSASESAVGRLINYNFTPDQLPSLIETIFAYEDAGDTIRSLPGDGAQIFIDVLFEALDRADLSPSVRKQCLRPLYKMCGRHAFLPKSLNIPVCYDRTSDALYSGGFADVWKGEHDGREVAVKVIRKYSDSDLQKMIGRFCKEVVTWRTLRHPNVLALIGVTMTETKFAMISDWMANGNIIEFVKAHPDANRFRLLEDVANGLIYLHSQGMIHGDLKGANVLIDETCHARLADFGLLKIISDPANPSSSSSCTQGGSTRWMSPELIDPRQFTSGKPRPTKSSDCYALGMVTYETISGNVPFHRVANHTVTLMISAGEHPPRDVRFTDGLWRMLEKCWMFQPNDRPYIEEVLQCLKESSRLPVPLSPESDIEMDGSCGDSSPTSSLSGVPNRGLGVDTRVTERAAMSAGRESLTSRPVIKAHVNSMDQRAANLNSRTPWTDLKRAGIHQDRLTTVGMNEAAEGPSQTSDTRPGSSTQGHGAAILGRVAQQNNERLKDDTAHEQVASGLVYQRLLDNITGSKEPEFGVPNWICIPQSLCCHAAPIPDDEFPSQIAFVMADGTPFPAELALAGQLDLLVDRNDIVFTGLNHTTNIRIEWPGYDAWGAQIAVDYQLIPFGITRAKLATEIVRLLHNFIETMASATISPAYETFKVGPGGIELRHIGIYSLVRVSWDSWQPHLTYRGS